MLLAACKYAYILPMSPIRLWFIGTAYTHSSFLTMPLYAMTSVKQWYPYLTSNTNSLSETWFPSFTPSDVTVEHRNSCERKARLSKTLIENARKVMFKEWQWPRKQHKVFLSLLWFTHDGLWWIVRLQSAHSLPQACYLTGIGTASFGPPVSRSLILFW